MATSCLAPVALLGGCGEDSAYEPSESLDTTVTPAQPTSGNDTGAAGTPTEPAYTGPYLSLIHI